MSGHNKWSQIKTRKGAQDQKKGVVFSKALKAISVAAKESPNPDLNPRLRALIEKAREANVPNENIKRAIDRASEAKDLKECIAEAYGPEKVAIIVEAITDNNNRTLQELRNIILEHGAKVADAGSVLWAFEKTGDEWKAKFPQAVSDAGKTALASLVESLEEQDDVQRVITNAS